MKARARGRWFFKKSRLADKSLALVTMPSSFKSARIDSFQPLISAS